MRDLDVTMCRHRRHGHMQDYTNDDVTSLASKLDALELTTGERAALDAIFDAVTAEVDDEVVGFAAEAPHANHEVSYFLPRLGAILFFDEADAVRGYVGETEKNFRG